MAELEMSRITGGNGSCRNIPRHHRARSDYGSSSDGNSRKNDGIGGDPGIVADGDGVGGAGPVWVADVVAGSENLGTIIDTDMAADGDGRMHRNLDTTDERIWPDIQKSELTAHEIGLGKERTRGNRGSGFSQAPMRACLMNKPWYLQKAFRPGAQPVAAARWKAVS